MSDEPQRIWLQPRSCVDEGEGRQWCEDNVWPMDDGDAQGVEYVRADLTRTEPSTVTDEGLVERVARAVHEQRRKAGFVQALWEYEPRTIHVLYENMARAALEASGHTALLREIEVLRSALERLDSNFDLLLRRKPVRDVAETKAEVNAALEYRAELGPKRAFAPHTRAPD
jgi:hypothetical protein